MAEAEAVKAKVDFTFATPEVKEALLWLLLKSLKAYQHNDRVNEQLEPIDRSSLKALDGRLNNKRKKKLSAPNNRSDRSISKPNHPSGEAYRLAAHEKRTKTQGA